MTKHVTLGNLVEIRGGGTPSKDVPEYWKGSIPWASVKDVKSARLSGTTDCISEAGLRNSATQIIPAGCIIVPTRMAVGKAAINEIDLAINQDLKALFPAPGVDTKYLLHAILAHGHLLEKQATGATVKGIKLSVLRSLEIPLPPLDEQRRIAAILDKADSLRQKRKQAIALLDSLTQSIFLEMFGDPASNPKGWPQDCLLSDVADIASGITKGRKLRGAPTRSVPYLAVANVQDKALRLDSVKSIDATESEIARYRLCVGDLLLTEGGDPDKLGRGTIWKGEIDEAIHQNHIFRARLTSKHFRPTFINWLLGSSYGKDYFLKSAKQTTGIASINRTQLSAFPMLRPPIQLQLRFEHIVEAVNKQRKRLAACGAGQESLFASLQDRAFAGEL